MIRFNKIEAVWFSAVLLVSGTLMGCANTPPTPAKAPLPEVLVASEPTEVSCPDGDQDGVCDADDRCPTKSGPDAAFGCPIDPCGGAPLLLVVQFDYDSAQMPPRKTGVQTMDPVLDKVAEAIAQDSSCRVCIIGHASEEGTAEYNEDLSKRRATAVQGYMIDHDLAEARMPATGLGERCQLDPERTPALNRRVEFRRLKEGKSCPTNCSD